MATLKYRKDRQYWEGRYKDPSSGLYRRVRLSKDKKSAQRQLNIIVGKIEEGKDPIPKRKEKKTISEFLSYWATAL